MNDDTTVQSPFASTQVAARPSNAIAASDQQRAIAEVQAAMVIARANPRDPIAAMDRILNACTRPTLADAAVYQYSKGGSDVSGPSIRLAEAMAQQWGNISFGIRELEQRGGESTVQAFAWDIETNVKREITFQVPHIRYTRSGSKRLEDPRDIYEMVANQGSRRLRACILAVIPGDVTEAAVKQCEATMKTRVEITPEFIATLLERFAEFGITKEQIEKRIQRHIESLSPAQAVQLKKIHTSMKDGMSIAADWFDPIDASVGEAGSASAPASATEAAKAAVKKRAKGEAASGAGAPAGGAEGPTFAQLSERMQAAKDADVASLILDEGRGLSQDEQNELAKVFAQKFPS